MPDHAYDVSAWLAPPKQFAKARDMDAEIGFDDDHVRPRTFQQLVLADEFAGALHQGRQNVERAAADPDRHITFEQQVLTWKKPEGSKGQYLRASCIRPSRHSTLLYGFMACPSTRGEPKRPVSLGDLR